MFKLALIDDDRNFLQLATMVFNEYQLSSFSDPEEAIIAIKNNPPDAVIMDLHMGQTNGFSVCQEIKKTNFNLPVFFLTSDNQPKQIGQGFELGCIDYLVKSLPVEELRIRISQRLKQLSNRMPGPRYLECSGLRMNCISRELSYLDMPIKLSTKEIQILEFFLKNQNHIYTKTELLNLLWDGVNVDGNNIDTHMFNIRKKLPAEAPKIKTLKGQGFILKP